MKINNQRIDNLLNEKLPHIKRLSDFVRSLEKIKFLCTLCGREFETRFNTISKSKYGCFYCAKKLASTSLTTDEINDRLKKYNICLIGNYENNNTYTDFKCLNCNTVFQDIFRNLEKNAFCPNCNFTRSRLLFTNEQVDLIIDGYTVKRIEDYKGNNTPIKFKCLIEGCNYIWFTAPSSIFKGSKCPKCYGNILLTNEEIDKRLLLHNIKRVGNYINMRTHIDFQCINCFYIWKTAPGTILGSETGCPLCNVPGYNEKIIINFLKTNNIDFKYNWRINKINSLEEKLFRIDFYIPNIRLVIEYNGNQHYEPTGCFDNCSKEEAISKLIKQQERDKYVNEFCENNNIQIIWIDGRKLFNYKLENYLNTDFLHLLNNKKAIKYAN